MSGVADVKEAVKCAKHEQVFGRRTVLFIDEIHRFNKLQQARFGIFVISFLCVCVCDCVCLIMFSMSIIVSIINL